MNSMPYLLIDLPQEVNFIGQALQLSLQLNFVHVGLIHVLLNEHKVIFTLCTLVDLIFIPERKIQSNC